jgi:hypothetical protein
MTVKLNLNLLIYVNKFVYFSVRSINFNVYCQCIATFKDTKIIIIKNMTIRVKYLQPYRLLLQCKLSLDAL